MPNEPRCPKCGNPYHYCTCDMWDDEWDEPESNPYDDEEDEYN